MTPSGAETGQKTSPPPYIKFLLIAAITASVMLRTPSLENGFNLAVRVKKRVVDTFVCFQFIVAGHMLERLDS